MNALDKFSAEMKRQNAERRENLRALRERKPIDERQYNMTARYAAYLTARYAAYLEKHQ